MFIGKKSVILVDFDFTLAIHRSLDDSNKSWALHSSERNEDLVKRLQGKNWFVFTARGLGSKRSVKEWCRIRSCEPSGYLFAGNTKNKLTAVYILSKLGMRLEWYDDLSDWKIEEKKIVEYEFKDDTGNVNFNRIKCISTDSWLF